MTAASELDSIPSSPRPRRLSRARWLDVRVIVGVILVLGSVFAGARVVAAADDRVRIVAVRSSLHAGTQLGADQLVSVRVAMNATERARYVSVPSAATGQTLVRDVGAGELLSRSALVGSVDTTTLVIPLVRDAAPAVAVGQRVTVWITAPPCGTHVLLSDVTVQSVHRGDGGSFDDSGGQSIVVSVPSSNALLVVTALAIDRVSLHAGRIDGTGQQPASPSFDIDECVSTPQ